jgi:membrane protease YdiL (CAAX protease family)
MTNPFWNQTEKRIRALWRFFTFLSLMTFAGLFASAISLGIGVGVLAAQSGSLPAFDGVSDFVDQVAQALTTIPFLSVLDTVLSTLAFLGALWLLGKWLDRRPFADFGFRLSRAWWIDFSFGLGLGAVLMGLIFVVELAAGWITIAGFLQSGRQPFWIGILNAFMLFIGVGIREEILFRGYPLRVIAEGLNLKRIGPKTSLLIAFILSSVVFGIFHLANPNATWISTANIAAAGFLLGIGFVLTGELAIPIGLHISWNFFQGNVFGFPVSGTNAGTTFLAIRQGGPELVTGGAFGPEAGLLGLAAMALGFGLTVAWIKWRYGKVALKLDLSIYKQ